MNYLSVIKRPIISEKSTRFAKSKSYVFEVAGEASKGAIKKAVEDLFNVTVLKVRTLRNAGKQKRSLTNRKTLYRKPVTKKAVIEVNKDQKIDLFDVSK